MPGQPVRSRIPSQPTDQSAGQARTGTGAVSRGTAWMPQVAAPPGRAPEPRDAMVRRGRRQPGAVMMSQGRVPRIAPALVPASPAGPGRRSR
jgi:hypothetical protein